MTKIIISGASGKMGRSLVKASKDFAVNIEAKLDKGDDLSSLKLDFDVLIDFTRPAATLNYLDICAKTAKKMVIGTTGFSNKELLKLKKYSKKIPIVFAPNMSIGINLMLKLLAKTANTIGSSADIEIVEAHHRHKVDAPSGTALKMGEVIAGTLGQDLKKCAVYNRQDDHKPRAKNTIGFASIRGGEAVGKHSAYFFLDNEYLEITHSTSSRIAFASGAIKAAIWLAKQNKAGLYSMDDVLSL